MVGSTERLVGTDARRCYLLLDACGKRFDRGYAVGGGMKGVWGVCWLLLQTFPRHA